MFLALTSLRNGMEGKIDLLVLSRCIVLCTRTYVVALRGICCPDLRILSLFLSTVFVHCSICILAVRSMRELDIT